MPKTSNNPMDAPQPGGAPNYTGQDQATTGQDINQLDSAASSDPTRPSDAGRPRTAADVQRTFESREANRRHSLNEQWRDEFPYHWRADDVVTRRDTLRFIIGGSAALFLASGALAVAGSIPEAAARPVAVARVGELGPNQWRVFDFPDQYSRGIIINLPGKGLVAYSDVCTHLSCAVLYQPGNSEMHCPCHDGVFSVFTGEVLAGPPPRPLPLIELREQNGVIYAVRLIER